jgi:site-specific recombinase XerD
VRTTALVEMYLRQRVRTGEIRPLTARGQRTTLYQFAVVAPQAHQINRRHIRTWQERFDHLSQSTKRNRLTTVRAFCRWLRDEGYLRSDPMKGIRPLKEPRRLPRALDPEQVSRIIEACPDQRAKVVVILMVQLGLRRGEVARLQVGDFDLTNRLVIVNGKGGHQRALHVTEEARRVVAEYLALEGAQAGPLVRSYQFPTRGLHPDTITAIVRRAMQDAGVKRAAGDGVSAHALRHSAITDMLRNGAHIRDIQAVAGHQHLSTSERYMPLMVGTLKDAMEGRRYV